MPPTEPRDCLLPASVWARLLTPRDGSDAAHRLDAVAVALYLRLWSLADRDGVVPVEPTLAGELRASVAPEAEVWPETEARAAGLALRTAGLALRTAGLALLWPLSANERGDEPEPPTPGWAWLPDVPQHAPPASLARPVEDDWPSPPADGVRDLLAVRLGRVPSDVEVRRACPRAFGSGRQGALPVVGDDPVARVWRAWAAYQDPAPARLSPATRRTISGALREVGGRDPAADLCLLVRYAHEADEPGPKFWRGANASGRTYLGLDSLLRSSKLPARLVLAGAWGASRPPEAAVAASNEDPGPLGRWLATRRGGR